jgi:hypothetical protein
MGWSNLGWKVLFALLILILLSLGISVPGAFVFSLMQAIVLLWGGLFVLIAGSNLFEGSASLRLAWRALSVGAYVALAVPAVVVGGWQMVSALGPVAALTLLAHLGRPDLARALRDWALVMALSLYTALGVLAMWVVLTTLGPLVFLTAVLLPPLIFEAAVLLLRRAPLTKGNTLAYLGALVLSTALAISVVSFTQFNPTMPLLWSIIFRVIAGLLIGGALLVSLLTRPMIEAASGTHEAHSSGIRLGRALVELSHSPFLISLAMYVPLRLLG